VEIRQLDASGQLSGISNGAGAPLREYAYDPQGILVGETRHSSSGTQEIEYA
jgi:YD repeat-containing protein